MNQELLALVQKYVKKGVLIDTNLALLYIVGSLDPLRIQRDRRTTAYHIDDFERLSKFVDAFKIKIVTPHVLTEISNLLGKDADLRRVFFGFIQISHERFLISKKVAESPNFSRFGLTDAAIIEIAVSNHLVVTDDAPLGLMLQSLGADVVSLSQIRQV